MGWTIRQRAATAAAATMVAALVLLNACGGSGATVATPPATPSPSSAPTAAPVLSSSPAPSPTPPVVEPVPTAEEMATAPSVSGFIYPIEGACLPASDDLLPNAPRDYRAGIHEGVDFYPTLACAAIAQGTSVLAAMSGVVARADWGFVEMTGEELEELLTRSQTQGYTDAESLDRFRGRQVWIDHGEGVLTRYAHLSGIAPGIEVGTAVGAGEVVGYVGNSGTPEAVTTPAEEMHLHFEIRVGHIYLGAGLSPEQVRDVLVRAFSTP